MKTKSILKFSAACCLAIGTWFMPGQVSAQTGSAGSPFPELYVDEFLKVGQNSIWLNSTATENRLFSTNGPLILNGVHASSGAVPTSSGSNTLINPVRGTVGIGLGSAIPKAKLDLSIGEDYLYRESGLRITTPIAVLSGGSVTNTSIFHIQKEYQLSSGSPITTKTQFIVKDRTGNVGINLDEPDSKLHVHNGRIKITGTNSYGGPMVLFGGTPQNAPAGQWGIEYIAGGNSGLNFWKPSGSNNVGNYYMFLADNGKVSIGLDPNAANTYNGNYKLYVGTGIMTEKVKVAIKTTSDWADYVFADDYELQPLSEVKAFIEKENHLPDVPSAEEVVESGVNVAEMDALLLRKIEELTLHLIELEERNETLEQRLERVEQ